MEKGRHIAKGKGAEELAGRFLTSKGFSVLKRNYCSPFGEIDLIIKNKEALHFVEVKARWSERQGGPFDQITYHKKRHLCRAAAYYLNKFPPKQESRLFFSVIGIQWKEGEPQIQWLPNAFESVL